MDEIQLSETTEFIVDNRGKTAPTVQCGIPLIATNCITNNNLYPVYENLRYVSEATYANWFRAHPLPGDIILTLKGSKNGAVCLVPDPVNFVIAQDMVALRADTKIIDPMFLFAALRSPQVQMQIQNLDVSGIIPHLKKTDFDKLYIPFPDKVLQKYIGAVYYNFSRKIDLLHRQNKTLEALAETLFRQMFIENAQEDWEEKPLDQIAEYLNGLACQKYPPTTNSDRLPVLKIRELKSGIGKDSDWASINVPNKYIIESGDIIFSWSASLLLRVWNGERSVLNQHLFKVTSEKYPDWLIYFWTKLFIDKFVAIAESHATTMGHIKRKDLSSSITVVPKDLSEISDLDDQMRSLWCKMLLNYKQINDLEHLRDSLLPKLMSGEVRVAYEGD